MPSPFFAYSKTKTMKSYFYNTIGLNAKDLTQANKSNAKQEDTILKFLNTHPGSYTAWELHDFADFYHIPITSIRRALHNLMDRCLIKETGMSVGPYGKPVTKYSANIFYQPSLF